MRRMFASLVAALIVVSGASACLNDSELPGHEREFRSSYQRQVEEPKEEKYLPTYVVPVAMYSGGGLLLLGAGLVAVRKPSKKG